MTIKRLLGVAALATIAVTLFAAKPEQPAITGAEPGKWTMDIDAAKALAKEKELPLLLNFTGSDWCGWCKLMDRNVFSQKEWQSYAAKNVVLVWIDFPRNKSLVPKNLVSRNQELQSSFGVRGYPTYIVLGSDGSSRLGRLGASQTATPASFIADLEKLTKK